MGQHRLRCISAITKPQVLHVHICHKELNYEWATDQIIKRVSFLRNCGAALVEEYNKVI